MSKPNIVVLMGGPDAEREISIKSGTAVAAALHKNPDFNTTLKLIDTPSTEELVSMNADVIFPVLHGPFGEGGPLQQLLEKAKVPFVGSSSIAAANAMNKVTSKEVAKKLGIPTPSWAVVQKAPCELAPPLVLKPLDDGSSVDIAICKDTQEVNASLEKLLQKRTNVLAETFINGREITVGIINGKPLPVIEIIPQTGNYDFAAKYERNDTQYIVDPSIPDDRCISWSVQLVREMKLRDVARVDFIIDRDGPWFLEVNTMPGFTDCSLLPMAASHHGLSMVELCSKLVVAALARTTPVES